jgi:hypothetical protein
VRLKGIGVAVYWVGGAGGGVGDGAGVGAAGLSPGLLSLSSPRQAPSVEPASIAVAQSTAQRADLVRVMVNPC